MLTYEELERRHPIIGSLLKDANPTLLAEHIALTSVVKTMKEQALNEENKWNPYNELLTGKGL